MSAPPAYGAQPAGPQVVQGSVVAPQAGGPPGYAPQGAPQGPPGYQPPGYQPQQQAPPQYQQPPPQQQQQQQYQQPVPTAQPQYQQPPPQAQPMPQAMPGHQLMAVTCPPGMAAGSAVQIQGPSGASFQVRRRPCPPPALACRARRIASFSRANVATGCRPGRRRGRSDVPRAGAVGGPNTGASPCRPFSLHAAPPRRLPSAIRCILHRAV